VSAADRPRCVAIVAHAAFPADPRIRRQADTLVEAGYEVDVLCLREDGEAAEERDGAVRVVRLPVRRRFTGFAGHLAEYLAFTAVAGLRLTREFRRRRYRLIQVATLPDFLVAAAAAPKISGVPLLLDLHEDMPAFFDDRFNAPALRPFKQVVRGVTRASAAMADHLLTVHEPLRQLSIARGVPPDKITVVMNSPDERLFNAESVASRRFMEDGELRLVHASNLQRIYGLSVAVQAMARLVDLPVRLEVYGDGPYRWEIEAAIAASDVADRVKLHGRVPVEQLPAILAGADAALVPSLREPYLQLSLSTKLLEAVAMGVPVIASDLATFRTHFTDAAVRYVPGGDPSALAAAIRELAADPAVAATRVREARRQAEPYAWRIQAARYLEVVDRLSARGSP